VSSRNCARFRARLFADRDELMKIIAAGGHPTDGNGRPRKPLSLRSIQMMMNLLAQILDDAVADKLHEDNPARSKRLRVRVPKPERRFLEIDQLVALLDAVGELERAPRSQKRAKLTASEVTDIRERLRRGETQYALRLEFGLSSGSMSMLANGKTYRGDNGRIGWRALCATLGYAGPRISEALDLLERDVRLHDPSASRLWVSDSKTETGVRDVEGTPKLCDILLAHRAQKIRCGCPVEPERPFFCTRKGTRWDEGNVRERLLDAGARLAGEKSWRMASRRCRTSRQTRCAAPTSRSFSWRRTSTSRSYRVRSGTPTPSSRWTSTPSCSIAASAHTAPPSMPCSQTPRRRCTAPGLGIWPTKRFWLLSGHFPFIRVWL
jgi:integrase